MRDAHSDAGSPDWRAEIAERLTSLRLAPEEEAECHSLAEEWGLSWSPVFTDESCMSLFRLGVMNTYLGSLPEARSASSCE